MKNKNSIIDQARKTITQQASVIHNLVSHVDDVFIKCADLISTAKGRLIITGIGKSGLIAQKLSSTFNSTGTSSYYMHAADAIHGDVGMIREGDVILILSKSGETAELKALIPLVKNFGNRVLAMCSNPSSYLFEASHHAIYIPIDQEADPNNLAPTTSSVAQLAMGHALAIAVLTHKGFSANDFAQFHPGGSIGKQMYLRVKELVSKNEKPQIDEDASIQEAIIEMTTKRLGAVVVTRNGAIRGIITDGDLRRMLKNKSDLQGIKLTDIMSIDPISIAEDALVVEALTLMRKHSITQLISVRDETYTGIVHVHDILKEGII